MGNAAKAFGDLFEDLFFLGCRRTPGMVVTRFPDGCKVVGKNRLVRVKTPCDWVITYGGVSALIDTKTTAKNTFPFSKIETHQVDEMARHQSAGAKAGYVIWFRQTDDIIFVASLLLSEFISKRGSLKCEEGNNIIHLGKSRDFNVTRIFGIN